MKAAEILSAIRAFICGEKISPGSAEISYQA
jgi:hypothetical protein